MKARGDDRMGESILSQERVGVAVKPEGFGGNRIAEGSVLSISMAEHPNIVTALLERFVEILPSVRESLESSTAGNASAPNPLRRVAG